MDLLQGIKDMEQDSLKDVPPAHLEDMPMPNVNDLLKALEGFTGMSEEEKDLLRDQLTGKAPGGFMPPEQSAGGAQQFLILLSLLFVVACIFVFFGYKLYKSLAEKEKKRDEKRKMKQLKKKK